MYNWKNLTHRFSLHHFNSCETHFIIGANSFSISANIFSEQGASFSNRMVGNMATSGSSGTDARAYGDRWDVVVGRKLRPCVGWLLIEQLGDDWIWKEIEIKFYYSTLYPILLLDPKANMVTWRAYILYMGRVSDSVCVCVCVCLSVCLSVLPVCVSRSPLLVDR